MAERVSLREQLASLDEEIEAEEYRLWGRVAGPAGGVDLSNSPRFKEVVTILHEQPMLVAPALEWLRVKRAAMARAQLEVLYTPEQLEEMANQAQSDKGK